MTPAEMSAALRDVAKRIDRNKDMQIGGVAVVIPPEGEPMIVLNMGTVPKTTEFCAMVGAKVAMMGKQADEASSAGGFVGAGQSGWQR